MALSKRIIEKKIEKYLIEKDGFKFIKKEDVKEVENLIITEYKNVYFQVVPSDIGRSKLQVGNVGRSKVGKPQYEVYID